jgi:hypothetical protein
VFGFKRVERTFGSSAPKTRTKRFPAEFGRQKLVLRKLERELPSSRYGWSRVPPNPLSTSNQAYSDEHTYRPVGFDSLDDLLKVFKAALPAFDVSSIPHARQPGSSILFADVVKLSETQRSILGLKH